MRAVLVLGVAQVNSSPAAAVASEVSTVSENGSAPTTVAAQPRQQRDARSHLISRPRRLGVHP
jgi:hypothetical protein